MHREVNEQWIKEQAAAACLCLGEEEASALAADLAGMLDALDGLEDPSDRADWRSTAVDLEELREDLAEPSVEREALLAMCKVRSTACFSVPPLMEKGDCV